MVCLHVKHGDESQFLFDTTVDILIDELVKHITTIYSLRLKVNRICAEIEELAEHGIALPPNMQGLTEEQITELKLKDDWAEKCIPSGGAVYKKDGIGRRNGQEPNEKMKEVLRKTVEETKSLISKKQIQANICVTTEMVRNALDQLRGAVSIVYPMGLPPHDPIRLEFEDKEDLTGTQMALQIIEESESQLWWAGKELKRGKKLSDYLGKNEKTKIIVKLQKQGQGAPAREPVVSPEDQKQMMLHYYRRQEELKKLEESEDDAYLDSEWADRNMLKRQLQNLNNIKWRPK
ncbi:cilia- and flagella-associated protein 298 isoform X1 [Erpetoichthys calabaricus]|uniref:cilia- and flagella-associated protein 298 isoform X1 n=1 Tax=Erpetoichthys calabaricus TaxID=27687 RepID=UPI00223422AD|nr:cilia- and flagella-associated protein 298 isoform X1 [Erpetoichthys calabaricus]